MGLFSEFESKARECWTAESLPGEKVMKSIFDERGGDVGLAIGALAELYPQHKAEVVAVQPVSYAAVCASTLAASTKQPSPPTPSGIPGGDNNSEPTKRRSRMPLGTSAALNRSLNKILQDSPAKKSAPESPPSDGEWVGGNRFAPRPTPTTTDAVVRMEEAPAVGPPTAEVRDDLQDAPAPGARQDLGPAFAAAESGKTPGRLAAEESNSESDAKETVGPSSSPAVKRTRNSRRSPASLATRKEQKQDKQKAKRKVSGSLRQPETKTKVKRQRTDMTPREWRRYVKENGGIQAFGGDRNAVASHKRCLSLPTPNCPSTARATTDAAPMDVDSVDREETVGVAEESNVSDASSAPCSLEVSPETLQFPIARGCRLEWSHCKMTLHHTGSTSDHVAFKVKTTHQRRYLVQPNIGIVPPGSSETVTIFLVDKDTTLVDAYDRRGDLALDDCRDKFLVESCAVPDEFSSQFLDEPRDGVGQCKKKELVEQLTSLWHSATKRVLAKTLLVQHVRCPGDPDGGAPDGDVPGAFREGASNPEHADIAKSSEDGMEMDTTVAMEMASAAEDSNASNGTTSDNGACRGSNTCCGRASPHSCMSNGAASPLNRTRTRSVSGKSKVPDEEPGDDGDGDDHS